MAFVGGHMPIERPKDLAYRSRSAYNSPITTPIVSPAGSRRSSVSSITSVKTDPGVDMLERLRQNSVASQKSQKSQKSHQSQSSATSVASSKSSFRSLFGKSKTPKEKKDYDKIVLTSKHAATVKTKLMLAEHGKKKPKVKTAGVVGTQKSGHLSAAQQEARHPHSGPPTLHRGTIDLPMLTRIVSGDEQDEEEDNYARNQRRRSEWEVSKQPSVCRVIEYPSDISTQTSADTSADEEETVSRETSLSPIEKAWKEVESRRPALVTRNSYGGRFHKDEKGQWRR